ncbi:MAG: DUF6308 family protein, partial [Actinomycetota bacterium]|nr:DUF6308 family protein [Actinomycetota bacterium]
MKLPAILTEKDQTENAANLLHSYFNESTITGQTRTGSHFEAWGGGGDRTAVANTLTDQDIVAVSFLGMRIKGEAAYGLLETHKERITKLLSEIPADIDLASLSASDAQEFIASGTSAASRLWGVFRNTDGVKWGVGATKASKLLARKRPRLIPIYDSVIDRVTQLGRTPRTQWTDWHAALTQSDLPEQVEEIRRQSGIEEPISELRVMDVVLWMHGMA